MSIFGVVLFAVLACTYDAHGNVRERHDATGQRITADYDVLDREVLRDWYGVAQPEDVVREQREYTATGEVKRTRQHTQAGGVFEVTATWDRHGRLSEEIDRYGQSSAHTYDASHNRTRRTDAAGETVYQHDRLNRLRGVQPAGEGAIVRVRRYVRE